MILLLTSVITESWKKTRFHNGEFVIKETTICTYITHEIHTYTEHMTSRYIRTCISSKKAEKKNFSQTL